MKITAEQIPPEVAYEVFKRFEMDTEREAAEAIAAALAAWPGMQMRPSKSFYAMTVHAHLVLPLPSAGAPTQGDACNG